ncbi:unnamed protein product, partial [Mesorhabditis belari]|uniref:VWFA domain-containing protein n=1 Tax=Mesorhabditis belari TaxID=2138241 RepID=A0AAF3ENG9_9BILA
MARSFDLVKVILAGVSAFLLLLTLIFIILFATKSTKATGFLVSFASDADSSAASKAIEKAFKDAKYTVRNVKVQEAGDGTWKGVVVVKGDQKVDDVSKKVKPDASGYSGLQIRDGSKALDICAPPPPAATTSEKPQSTPSTTAAVPTTWCSDNNGARDYVFLIDVIPSEHLGNGETRKLDVLGDRLDEVIKGIPSNARYAFMTIDGDDEDNPAITQLTNDVKALRQGRDEVIQRIKNANQNDDYAMQSIDWTAIASNFNMLKQGMKPTIPVSIVVITDHRPDAGQSTFFSLRNKGYFITALIGRGTSGYKDLASIPPTLFETYDDLRSDIIPTAMCTVNGDLSTAEPVASLSENSRSDLIDLTDYRDFVAAAKPTFECLTHDIVLVFDETQSIYNDTITDWKELSYKILQDFKWFGDLKVNDDRGVFTRISVVVFGGLEHQDAPGGHANRQVDKSDDNDYSSTVLFDLDKYPDWQSAKSQIAAKVFVYNGLTNITSALNAVQHVFDIAKNYGDDPNYNRTSKRVVITMTDGFLTADEEDATKAQAKILRENYKADLWFVLAEFNVDNVDFPHAYNFAVAMADNKPQRVFNSSKAAMNSNTFEATYGNEYPCPPKRCKVIYFACENTEVLDPMIKGTSNKQCVQESLQLAEYINSQTSNVTFRFLLYSKPELTTIYPAQGEDDSYANFVAQVTPLLDDTIREKKHGGFTYLADALNVIANSFQQYVRKNPLADGALFIAGQFEDGKIQDLDMVKAAAGNVRSKFSHFYVMDRSDPKRALPYGDPNQGWGMVAPKEQTVLFAGKYETDKDALEKIGFFSVISKLDCALPEPYRCKDMFDVQFVFHFSDQVDNDVWDDQKSLINEMLSQFKAPYPVHLGAYFLADDGLDVQMGLQTVDEITSLINVNATTTGSHDMSLWDGVVVDRFLANTGCKKTTSANDRPNVDNIVVIVSNDWTRWAQSAWTDVTNHMDGWKCKDCANYPHFVFLDLSPEKKHPDDYYPIGLNTNENPIYRISNFDLEVRESHNMINDAVHGICLSFDRNCCVDFPCQIYTGQVVCGQKSFIQQITNHEIY